MSSSRKNLVFIIAPQKTISEFSFQNELFNFELLKTADLNELIPYLHPDRFRIVQGFFDYDHCSQTSSKTLDFVDQILQLFPSTEIKLVTSSPAQLKADLTISGFDLDSISISMDPITLSSLLNETLSQSLRIDLEKINAKVSEKGFVPVTIDSFSTGQITLFDTFLKLGEGRLVRIFASGEKIDHVRLQRFIEKQVSHFYIRESDHQNFLKFATNNLKSPGQTQDSLLGFKTIEFLSKFGLSDQNLKTVEKVVTQVQKRVDEISQTHKSFKSFLENSFLYDHGTSIGLISSLIGQKSGIQISKLSEVVGMSGFTHNVGLATLPSKFHFCSHRDLSAADRMVYFKHPYLGAKIISDSMSFDPGVSSAVENHLFRKYNPNNNPMIFQKSDMNLVSEIIGIAREFHACLANGHTKDSIKKELEANVYPYFSKEIVRDLKDAVLI